MYKAAPCSSLSDPYEKADAHCPHPGEKTQHEPSKLATVITRENPKPCQQDGRHESDDRVDGLIKELATFQTTIYERSPRRRRASWMSLDSATRVSSGQWMR
jgi:hypothetical protein